MNLTLSLAASLEELQAHRRVDYVAARVRLHPDADSCVREFKGAFLIYDGAESPVNRVMCLGLKEALLEEDLPGIEEFYAVHGLKAMLDVCPLVEENMVYILGKRGYTVYQFDSVLVHEVSSFQLEIKEPPGIVIWPVNKNNYLTWLEVVSHGFSSAESDLMSMQSICEPNYHSRNSSAYLAYLDGKPAGGGVLYVRGHMAELGGDATLPDFRRRGVQTALIQHRMKIARKMGVRQMIFVSAPGNSSERNARRAGFEMAYSRTLLLQP
ncbi:N-acetyltransferase [Dehalococcoides mccartyi]|jgi:hypothetical protein|uniref:N-acetyltransferase domain-containing protein n=1 Tax=Dehalococcoides mccartyi TaxID=61435 RepID=A0A328EKI5_9CHLR|nr:MULTISPECIES: GNAT family N-acetyltransferase [Dehalococcoides]AGG06779.1 acetyltransferase, GNAT family [Dehalococcoides mccartyi DCMB5]AQX74991.1 N-acetyltransferase [Dehalococcoides mccartyi]AQY73566.1 N-acetyltransferase [Dehalococcoides mccartyi]RAL69185.1 hypothetical protein C1G87_1175 [Dehalococcoides mccartyi]RAL70312.1 hypothetical protein C1G86_1213 [Dehalococcoides mccartyi]